MNSSPQFCLNNVQFHISTIVYRYMSFMPNKVMNIVEEIIINNMYYLEKNTSLLALEQYWQWYDSCENLLQIRSHRHCSIIAIIIIFELVCVNHFIMKQ